MPGSPPSSGSSESPLAARSLPHDMPVMALPLRLPALLALALVLPALGGCVSPQERRAEDEAQCRSYGFRPGTDGFANCLQNRDLDRSAERRQLLTGPGYGYGYGGGFGFRRGPFW